MEVFKNSQATPVVLISVCRKDGDINLKCEWQWENWKVYFLFFICEQTTSIKLLVLPLTHIYINGRNKECDSPFDSQSVWPGSGMYSFLSLSIVLIQLFYRMCCKTLLMKDWAVLSFRIWLDCICLTFWRVNRLC